MEHTYGIKIQELMNFFCKGEHKGFSEEEIQEAEQYIGAALPDVYRRFLLTYGKDPVNTVMHTINEPDEICTTYQVIKEDLEGEWAPEFEEAVKNGEQEVYSDNEYFSLWQLPVEQWNTITENYVLIWCENQGVWNVGYLLQDLLDGKTDPPVYISTNDDFITFEKLADDMEHFMLEMLFQAAYEYGERYTDTPKINPSLADAGYTDTRINSILADAGVDLAQLKACGRIGTCMDSSKNKLYFYCEHEKYNELIEKYNELIVVNREELEELEE